MDYCPTQPLDALDHFLHQVDGDLEFEHWFYNAATPGEMVALAVNRRILIEADDFRGLLRSGSTEFWLARGGAKAIQSPTYKRYFLSNANVTN